MHDFGVSRYHTLILDFPLSLQIFPSFSPSKPSLSSWRNLLDLVKHPISALPLTWRIRPTLTYSPQSTSRIGVLPRYEPEKARWYTLDRKGGCVFHTVNAWDDEDEACGDQDQAVNLLVSRMDGDGLVWAAGNIESPTTTSNQHEKLSDIKQDECLLYYCM
jgi:carotenoid cleavage dioxygenase-like enzyme